MRLIYVFTINSDFEVRRVKSIPVYDRLSLCFNIDMPVRLNQKDDERIEIFYKTNERELSSRGLFIAESSLIIHRALNKGYEPVCFLIEEDTYDDFKDVFDRCDSDITVYEASDEIFRSLKGYILIKGILGLFKRKENKSIDEILDNSNRVVVMENVENPANVGSIFRNAAALYADAVILTDDSADPLYKRSIRVSMGNVFNIDWCYISKDNYMNILMKHNYKTASFALRDNSVELEDQGLNNEEKLAIIMGSEGYGLDDKTIDQSDYVIRIDMNSEVDSLNVASASAIALWQLCKNNRKGK